jgi:transposase
MVPHPSGLRAKALAALLCGERRAAVARDLGVPEATVRTWKRRLKNGRSGTLKKADFGRLLTEHLETSVRS